MGVAQKIGWLQGYRDGLVTGFTVGEVNGKDKLANMFPQSLSYGEVVQAADRLCAVPENAPVPLSFAAQAVAMKASGVSQTKIDEFISNLLSRLSK